MNKFSTGGGGGTSVGGGGTATPSNSQQPLASSISHPPATLSSATQSMTSLSRFANPATPTAATATVSIGGGATCNNQMAVSTISLGSVATVAVQANGSDMNQSRAEAERDSNNLS